MPARVSIRQAGTAVPSGPRKRETETSTPTVARAAIRSVGMDTATRWTWSLPHLERIAKQGAHQAVPLPHVPVKIGQGEQDSRFRKVEAGIESGQGFPAEDRPIPAMECEKGCVGLREDVGLKGPDG